MMNAPIPEVQLAEIKAALYEGRKIDAVKLYREASGTELLEARKAVEQLEAELRAASPERFAQTAPTRYRWPWFVLAAVILAILLAIAWMSHEVQRTRQIRDLNNPAPSRG